MNVNDSQIAAKVLSNYNYEIVDQLKGNETDIILVKRFPFFDQDRLIQCYLFAYPHGPFSPPDHDVQHKRGG